jgi:6-phosphofructokinase 2
MNGKVVTLTLNPAVDRSGNVRGLKPAEKLRCFNDRTDPGGGGINVARMLRRLDADTVAIFPAGGLTGELLVKLIRAEGIAFESIIVPTETRENFSVRDLVTGAQYRFVFPGPAMSYLDVERCCHQALQHVRSESYLVVSGSLPPQVASSTYGNLAKEAFARGAKVVLDCGGDALLKALGPALELVKINTDELQDIAGKPAHDCNDCIAAARSLLDLGVRMVAVTRGEQGAILVTGLHAWSASAPEVRAASTVGAGDSFLATLVWSLSHEKNPAEALRMAIAAGSAALLTEGTGLAWPSDMQRLAGEVQVKQIALSNTYAMAGD